MQNERNLVISNKIKSDKFFRIVLIVLAVTFLIVTTVNFINYIDYKKGQKLAVDLNLTLLPDEYDESKDYKKLAKEMYEDLTPEFKVDYFLGVKVGDNRDVVDAANKADKALGEVLKEFGYDKTWNGSYYLKYSNFFDYTFSNHLNFAIIPYYILLSLFIINGVVYVIYFLDLKKEMIIEDTKIICKYGKKVRKEFFIKDIKTVEFTHLKGVKVKGDAFKYQINRLTNAEEIKSVIMETLSTIPKEVISTEPNSNADELKKYKDLLDSGIITQEEFDAKKKQLLGL